MLLDILDDVFLLHLPLEAAEGAFNRFPVLDLDFSHSLVPPGRTAQICYAITGKRGF
jgi:hypothetical protein